MTETGCEPEAWNYLACALPVCVTFAPFGAFLSSHFHRQVQASMLYVLDTVALVRSVHPFVKANGKRVISVIDKVFY